MTSRIAVVFGILIGVGAMAAAWADPRGAESAGNRVGPKSGAEKPELPECPVMGEAVDFSVKTMTKSGPVYFCCSHCIEKYEADPAKYAEKVEAQRKVISKLPSVQVTCPMSGKPVDKKISTMHEGQKVSFCSKDCMTEFSKKPASYENKLRDSYSYQTTCPVTNEPIDPKAFITLKTGQRVFFCCQRCDVKFLKDPAKYVSALEAQGTRVDPQKVTLASPKDTKDSEDAHEHKHDHAAGKHEDDHDGH